jgi:hypothetical protein
LREHERNILENNDNSFGCSSWFTNFLWNKTDFCISKRG